MANTEKPSDTYKIRRSPYIYLLVMVKIFINFLEKSKKTCCLSMIYVMNYKRFSFEWLKGVHNGSTEIKG